MGKLEKDKDGNPVIVVPYHIRHLGLRQSIVLECGSKFDDVMNEPLPRASFWHTNTLKCWSVVATKPFWNWQDT